MATRKQAQAAKRNVKKAQKAEDDRAPARGYQVRAGQTGRGRGPAQAHRRHLAQDPGRTLRDRAKARPARQVENGRDELARKLGEK
jgi:hypothetical protein